MQESIKDSIIFYDQSLSLVQSRVIKFKRRQKPDDFCTQEEQISHGALDDLQRLKFIKFRGENLTECYDNSKKVMKTAKKQNQESKQQENKAQEQIDLSLNIQGIGQVYEPQMKKRIKIISNLKIKNQNKLQIDIKVPIAKVLNQNENQQSKEFSFENQEDHSQSQNFNKIYKQIKRKRLKLKKKKSKSINVTPQKKSVQNKQKYLITNQSEFQELDLQEKQTEIQQDKNGNDLSKLKLLSLS